MSYIIIRSCFGRKSYEYVSSEFIYYSCIYFIFLLIYYPLFKLFFLNCTISAYSILKFHECQTVSLFARHQQNIFQVSYMKEECISYQHINLNQNANVRYYLYLFLNAVSLSLILYILLKSNCLKCISTNTHVEEFHI